MTVLWGPISHPLAPSTCRHSAVPGPFFRPGTLNWAKAQLSLPQLLRQLTTVRRWNRESPCAADEWQVFWGGGEGPFRVLPRVPSLKKDPGTAQNTVSGLVGLGMGLLVVPQSYFV